MRLRIAVVAALMSLALGVGVASAASGQHSASAAPAAAPRALYTLAVHGVAQNGKRFTGLYSITGYVVKNNKVYARGALRGVLNHQYVQRLGVLMPASLTSASTPSSGATARPAQPTSCQILHLVLGPITLNLLGLHVTLGGGANADQPIVLDVTAVPGPNNLLGNLLCDLTGALNQGGALSALQSQLNQLAATLTYLTSLLGAL